MAKRRALETEITGAPITAIAPVSVLEQAKRLLDDLGRLWNLATSPSGDADNRGDPDAGR